MLKHIDLQYYLPQYIWSHPHAMSVNESAMQTIIGRLSRLKMSSLNKQKDNLEKILDQNHSEGICVLNGSYLDSNEGYGKQLLELVAIRYVIDKKPIAYKNPESHICCLPPEIQPYYAGFYSRLGY